MNHYHLRRTKRAYETVWELLRTGDGVVGTFTDTVLAWDVLDMLVEKEGERSYANANSGDKPVGCGD